MRKAAKITLLLVVTTALSLPVLAQKRLSPAQAKDHVGETATVCGTVASTKFAASSHGQPTFLNLDEPYPRQIFTVLIWREDRAKFGRPEEKYRDKHLCVTGKITSYRGTPEIIARDPAQIEVQ